MLSGWMPGHKRGLLGAIRGTSAGVNPLESLYLPNVMFIQASGCSSPSHRPTILPGQINTRSPSTSSDQLYLKWRTYLLCVFPQQAGEERHESLKELKVHRNQAYTLTKKSPHLKNGPSKYLLFHISELFFKNIF